MTFFEKLRCLAQNDFSASAYSEEENELYLAAKAFLLSDEVQVEAIVKKLFKTASDEIKSIAVSLIPNILMQQERFEALSEYDIPRNDGEAAAISLYNVKETRMDLTEGTDCLDLLPNEMGWAVVTVKINGHDINLMVDTGAGITVINETTANKCGVIRVNTVDKALEAQDANSNKIVLPTAMIDEISIGTSVFSNKICMVIPDNALDFGTAKINGTIGWELINKLKWVFNFKEKKVFVSKPKPENVCKNMSYDAFPMVRVEINNKQMYMGLDTGANATMFGKSMINNINVSNMAKSSIKVGAAGGYNDFDTFIIPDIKIKVGEGTAHLKKLYLLTDSEKSKSGFFITPGIIGMDIAQQGVLTLNYFNRHICINNPA